MYDCIYFTDICKELVAKTLTLGCTLYQTRDINKFDNSRCHLLRVVKNLRAVSVFRPEQ